MEQRAFEADGLKFTVRTKTGYIAYLDANSFRYDVMEIIKAHEREQRGVEDLPAHIINICFDFSNIVTVTSIVGDTPLATIDIVQNPSDENVIAAWQAYQEVIRRPGVIDQWVEAYNALNKVATSDDEKKDDETPDND